MFYNKKFKPWFTLIEIMIWIVIFSIVIVSGFTAYFSVLWSKAKLIERTTIEKNAFYFSEKVFEMIKKWWEVDYEEYFNRIVTGNSTYSSWHYMRPTWFWNFWHTWIPNSTIYWSDHYYCISWNWSSNRIWTWWCYNTTRNDVSTNMLNNPQRYWQYYLNYIDYNYDYNSDWWDHDWDWNFRRDDDDEFTWEWPEVFISGTDVKELYLISNDRKSRTLFRWNVRQDPDHPSFPASSCDFTNPQNPTGSWCLWTIEFLKLDWKDWWNDHASGSNDSTEFDWVIDTWLINQDFTSTINEIAWSTLNYNRVRLFPDDISVRNFKLFVYPNKDRLNAWKNTSPDVNISPYIKMQMTLTPSWLRRQQMKWKIPEIPLNMTISLSNILSNN